MELLEAIFEVDINDNELEALFSHEENFFDRAQILTQMSEPSKSRASSVEPTHKQDASSGQSSQQLQTENLKISISSPSPQLSKPAVPPSPAPGTSATSANGQSQLFQAAQEQSRLRKRAQKPGPRPVSQPPGSLAPWDEEEEMNFRSPLARLFSSATRRPPRPIDYAPSNTGVEEALIGIKRLEGMIESLRDDRGTAQKLKADLNELQVRTNYILVNTC